MPYRRNSDQPLAWKRWVAQCRDELNSAGVPETIYSNEVR
jgi:hypothetical protein